MILKSQLEGTLILFSLIFVLHTSIISMQENIITGKVYDAKTNEPLIGVNIVVNELPGFGATSDINGSFNIPVESGSYSITASFMGYQTVVKTDVIVKSGSEAKVTIRMTEVAVELQQITIKADYFDKAVKENDLSTVILGAEEIRRSPGSAQDFQRILQGMAGVSFSNDQSNELLVRGGSANENLTVFDNMEIHSTNHYPNEYNSGGPINMINVDLIEDIQFSTGGFISKYGDKLSSVMNITTREGTRNNLFNANMNLSMAGAGGVFEGRIDGGRGSWIVSARKSYLDLIKGAVGLTAVPKYYDVQWKAAYDITNKHKISWSGIYGNDRIFIEDETDEKKPYLANKTDYIGIEKDDVKQEQWATGITLRSLWSKNLFSILTLYYNNYHNEIDVKEEYLRLGYNSYGDVYKREVLNQRQTYNDKHDNGEGALKAEFVWNVDNWNEINFGGSLRTGNFIQDIYIGGDSSRYDIAKNGWNTPDDIYISMPESKQNYKIKLFSNHKDYVFINDKIKLFDERLILNAGLRYDYFSYCNKGNISPRLSASYYIIPGLTSVNFAYGDYYQTQNYPTYGDRYKTMVNKFLKNTHAQHFILGYEQYISDGLQLTVEGYYKKYKDIPVSEEFIHFNDRTFRSQKNLSVGQQISYGVDLLLQQKLVKDIYGTLAYSRMWSKFKDPRIGKEGNEYPADYEFPHVLTLIVGKRFANLRDELDEMSFFIKYPTYILPFSNDMDISIRWRFASGKVYTPKIYTTFEQHWQDGARWSQGTWISSDNINSARYPDYHRLDIAFNSRYNFKSWSLSIFLSVENIYNRKNVAAYQYHSDGTIDNVYQYSLFPVGGVEIQF
jgi:hypothetical protein